ncbi:hypothetical protein BDY19DRAFT_152439 [Irpex rosettiformis]|uniref:Uncharacterized protein n=1 Tax=Irpex rosettiformis TaxID=378272 RepID=A0ACB8U3L5_9APHY|nr:hypothetical protein BDY19DRAFT_152439 [Irpex rosettiformis]
MNFSIKKKPKKGHMKSDHAKLSEMLAPPELASIISYAERNKEKAAAKLLVSTLKTGVVIDTKFFAFSRRKSGGGVDRPLPIYTNSLLLMAGVPHFITILGSGFAEDRTVSLDEPFPTEKEYLKDEYDYPSDSDLEDDEEECSIDVEIPLAEKKKEEPDSTEASITESSKLELPTGGHYGRIIVLPTGAHKTWEALLAYLYTGEIKFALLKSHPDHRRGRQSEGPFEVLCSPKSMYRLAHAYGLENLKKEAAANIESQLTPDNIMQELKSSLTVTHEEILKMEVDFASRAAQRPRILPSLLQWIADLSKGEMTHTTHCLQALVKEIATNGNSYR